MSKERISDQIVIRVRPSLRARLEQEAERAGIELSSLARLKLEREDHVQLPQREAA
jgi:predicted HicB family RNase H-like nuclease